MTLLKTLSSNRWAYSPLIAFIGPYSAKAHEGHGDTVVHAVIHLSEDGLFIGLAIVLVCALLVINLLAMNTRKRHRAAKSEHCRSTSHPGEHHDSR